MTDHNANSGSGNPRKYQPTNNDLKRAIVEKLDLKAFYESYLKNSQTLKIKTSDGWTERVFCPLHNDTTTANFFCSLKTGGFKCMSCEANGSVFDFWLLANGYSKEDKTNFKTALLALAEKAGLDIAQWNLSPGDHHHAPRTPSGSGKSGKPDADETFIPAVSKADSNDTANNPLPTTLVESMQKALGPDHIKFLNQQRGLTRSTIEDYRLGWDEKAKVKTIEGAWQQGRFAIPIPDRQGHTRNIRLYSNLCESAFKMINYVAHKKTVQEKGYGKPVRLFNLDRLIKHQWEHVILCEGEWDCILLNQELKKFGLSTWGAVSGTHGANTFEAEWLQYLFGKHVYFCYDCDEAGKMAAANHATKYLLRPMQVGKFLSARIVELPLDGSKDSKDITDFFLKSLKTIDEFVKLCGETPELIAGGMDSDDATIETIEVEDLVTAVKDRRYIDQRISVPLTISGSTSRVYHAIRSYRVSKCPLFGKECCSESKGESTIPYGHPLFIQSCMEKTGTMLNAIANIACQKDQQCSVSPITKVVMEEYYANQVVERWKAEEGDDGRMRNSQELVQVPIYVLQPPDNMPIEPQSYRAVGFVRTHPKTNIATLFVESMIPMEEDWKKFTLESADQADLIRTIKNDFTIDQIINDLTTGVTKIYESDDILYTVLLTFLSPLWIHFNGTLMRGWINACIIGDSGTGKSASYMRLADWLELGDLFSMLSGGRTGLLYAIKQKAGEWQVSIGRYVQASGKIIAIDETQEMPSDEIKRMAKAMDEGWLQVSQVASGGYHTQTRTIFLMNPKNVYGKAATISDFTHGCDSLKECFAPMFIRRLDIAIFTMGRHNYEFYNQLGIVTSESTDEERQAKEIRLTPRLFRALIYWAWTRRSDQIHWSEEATKECLSLTTKLSEAYGYVDDIPLVSPQDFRNNLARLSTAYAILDRNLTEDLQGVIIEPRHVRAMASFVDLAYSSSACSLKQRSKHSRRRNVIVSGEFDKIKSKFDDILALAKKSSNPIYAQANVFCQLLLLLQQIHSIRKRDLADQLGVSPGWVQSHLSILQGFDLIEMTKTGYKTTRKFNLFMLEWIKDSDVAHMLEAVHLNLGKYAMARDDSEEWGRGGSGGVGGNGGNNGVHREYSSAEIEDQYYSEEGMITDPSAAITRNIQQ